MGGRHSDQGFFDNMNLLTLNSYSVDGMKDFVEAQTGKCTGEKGQMTAVMETRASWDGFCLSNNGEQILEGGGSGRPRKPRHKNHFCGHCVSTGVLIYGRRAVWGTNKATSSSDEARSENQGLEESSIANSLGRFSPCVQSLASKGAWICLLPIAPETPDNQLWAPCLEGHGGFPLSIGSTSKSQASNQGPPWVNSTLSFFPVRTPT